MKKCRNSLGKFLAVTAPNTGLLSHQHDHAIVIKPEE